MVTDTETLDSIACLLAVQDRWTAADLESIAEWIAATGRPHPGKWRDNGDPETDPARAYLDACREARSAKR